MLSPRSLFLLEALLFCSRLFVVARGFTILKTMRTVQVRPKQRPLAQCLFPDLFGAAAVAAVERRLRCKRSDIITNVIIAPTLDPDATGVSTADAVAVSTTDAVSTAVAGSTAPITRPPAFPPPMPYPQPLLMPPPLPMTVPTSVVDATLGSRGRRGDR